MAYFTWKEEYSVNVAQVDEQHKRLVVMLNELFEAMKAGQARDMVGVTLSKLVDYTRKHLTDEEALLKASGYPAFFAHQKEHIRLTEQVLAYQKQFQDGNTGVSVHLSNFLKDWLINHIQQVDQKYSPFLNSKGYK